MSISYTTQGYTTLLAVLIVGTIGSVIATTLLENGLNSSRMSTTREYAALSRSLNLQCIEKSLLVLHDQNTFLGTITETTDFGSCTSTITNQDINTKIISTTSTVTTIIKISSVQVSTTNPLHINVWNEKP